MIRLFCLVLLCGCSTQVAGERMTDRGPTPELTSSLRPDVSLDLEADAAEPSTCVDPGRAYAGCHSMDGAFDPVTGLVHSGAGTYDAWGRLISVEAVDADGVLTSRLMQNWSDSGQLLEVVLDVEGSVTGDAHALYTWTDDGEPATETWWYGQSVYPVVDTWHYDEQAVLTRWERDADADGLPEEVCSITWEAADTYETAVWTCDAHVRSLDIRDGRILEERLDVQGDGTIDTVTTTTWDGCASAFQRIDFTGESAGPRHDAWFIDTIYDDGGRRTGQIRSWVDVDDELEDIVVQVTEATYVCADQ